MYHGNFVLTDNKHKKNSLVVIKQSKGCRFVPKIHQNTLGGRALSRPAGSLCALPDAVAAMGPTYEEEGRGGEGREPTSK